ncbi:b5ad534c-532b-4aba-a319-0cdec13c05c9 [Thermothielavioides terrestris]|uniref:B5ad534c-532b-4aba-a319-0cdec13c05c9 n=1 Tax=Thermothielavioides terrestris TaxID=2587410 RepID=A0A3S5CWV6_9PEZI|nr:b5ad534c-532b-4aba-a319-0cdec13c05c9 [Thermothielavioides terrestris]
MSQLRTSRSVVARTQLRPLKTPLARPRRAFHTSRPRRADDTKNGNAAREESLSLSARLKKLSKEYGWTSVGVYLGLSVLDFPFCFLLVRTVGTEKIAHLEHIVVSNVQKVIPERVQAWWREYRQALEEARRERAGETAELAVIYHGVEEAEQRSKQEGASLATQLALAYAVHKSFIFLRVPLTAAVTPKVVKVLRSWGWQIGARKAKR